MTHFHATFEVYAISQDEADAAARVALAQPDARKHDYLGALGLEEVPA